MLFDRNSDAPWTGLDPASKELTSSQNRGSD
jgi:hypothetical protein